MVDRQGCIRETWVVRGRIGRGIASYSSMRESLFFHGASAMDQTTASPDDPQSRYNVRAGSLVELTVERVKGHMPAQLPAKLEDLSAHGAKVALETPLQFLESIALHVCCEAAGIDERFFAQVRWVRAGTGDTWLVGCSWESTIPKEILDGLAALGTVQRRASPRHEVDGEATLWWGPGKKVQVRFLDLSEGGFCLGSPEPGQGAWLRLVPAAVGEQRVQIIAQLRWERRTADGYQLGCKFTDPKDYAVLQRLLCHPPAGYRADLRELGARQ